MRLNVRVTEEDIERGIAEDCERCPVALALNRALADELTRANLQVSIDGGTILFCSGATLVRTVCAPACVRDFIFDFDGGDYTGPFEFTIRLPANLEALA